MVLWCISGSSSCDYHIGCQFNSGIGPWCAEVFTSITNGGEDLGTRGANTSIELTANMVVTEEDPDMHHKTMEGQPARDCAADHPKWRKLKSLAYTFLTVKPNSIAYNAIRQIEKCQLRCGLCTTG